MMNPLNISNFQRRKPRRSMLGTHRGYSIGFQHTEKAPRISETDSKTNSISASITNMSHKPPRKSVLGTRNVRRDSIFSLLPDTSFSSPININVDTVEKDDANDSFEENETFMMTNESEESVLATISLNNTTAEVTDVIPQLEKENIILSENNISVMKRETEDSTLTDMINTLNLIIENNTRSVNRYYKQIDEIKNEIEEKKRQIEDLIVLKCRLVKKFNLNEVQTIKSPEQIKCKLPEYKPTVLDQNENTESPRRAAIPSKQIIRELRSTITFLSTPRASRSSRPTIILTPHSMSFSIKSQLEKLLE